MLPNPALPTLTSSGGKVTEDDAINCYRYQSSSEEDSLLRNTCFGNDRPFSDKNIQRHYEHFRIRNVSKMHSVIWITSGVLCFCESINLFTSNEHHALWFMKSISLLRLGLSAVALFNCYNIFYGSVSPESNRKDFHSYVTSVTRLSNFIVIAISLVNGAAYVWKSSLGSCLVFNSESQEYELDNSDPDFYDCNPSFETGGTPLDAMMHLVLCNFYIIITLRCHSTWASRVNYFVTCISCVAAAALSPNGEQSLLGILSAFLSVIIYEGIEKNSLTVFKALLDLEATKRIQTRELKHFIGNVAHDLKTPLHGLAMCMDHLLMDSLDCLPRGPEADSMMHTIELCKANCSFMTTAINRTVDFTKTASNIALCAKMETTSVVSAMQWAVTCLTSQTKMSIEILPLPLDMCEYVVTDKHWLMENMLCYLSNAVKYSPGGKITIGVLLRDIVKPEDKEKSTSQRAGYFGRRSPRICAMKEENSCEMEDAMESRSSDSSVVTTRSTYMLCVYVEDEGIGVGDSMKATLFQPFQQTMRLAGGTGLGLYSLAKRVESLRGEYGVTSRRDGRPGSRFWFMIPYIPDEAYALQIEPISSKPTSSRSNVLAMMRRGSSYATLATAGAEFENKRYMERSDGSKHDKDDDVSTTSRTLSDCDDAQVSSLSALIVEDSLVISKATNRMLSKAGYVVDVAENGAIGLEKMKNKLYTIVVMDLQMPIMDGLEATRRTRSFESERSYIESGKGKQLIFGVSANGADDIKEEALASGMDSFVPKPFSIDYLIEFQMNQKSCKSYDGDVDTAGDEQV